MIRLSLLRLLCLHRMMMGMQAAIFRLCGGNLFDTAGCLRAMHHRGCGHIGERQRDTYQQYQEEADQAHSRRMLAALKCECQ